MYSANKELEDANKKIDKTAQETIKELHAIILFIGLVMLASVVGLVVLGVQYSKELAWKDAVVDKVCEYSGYGSTGCMGVKMIKSMDAEAIKNINPSSNYLKY